jgi:hypothetical protein
MLTSATGGANILLHLARDVREAYNKIFYTNVIEIGDQLSYARTTPATLRYESLNLAFLHLFRVLE